MSAAPDLRPLRLARARLAELGFAPAAVAALRASARATHEALRAHVLREVSGFSESGNPSLLPELAQHANAHIEEMLRLVEGDETGDFAFVRDHARLRAEQRFPLEWSLHAYRCGHRVLSRWLRDAAETVAAAPLDRAFAAIADFSIEYTDAISAALTAEYVAHTRAVATAEGDRDAELLNVLIAGYDESDGRAARLLRAGGYLEQRRAYVVLAIRPAHAAELETPGRAQRIVASLADLVAATPIRALAGLRHGAVVAVTSIVRRQSGWTAPQASLAEKLSGLLREWGPSVLIGISSDHPSTSAIPRALREALAALEFAGVERRVVLFPSLPVRSLLVHAGGEYVGAAPPLWVEALRRADADGKLMATLAALADADLNVQQAGRNLGVHPNTVYARLTRIRDLTGLDAQTFHGLVDLLLATDCAKA